MFNSSVRSDINYKSIFQYIKRIFRILQKKNIFLFWCIILFSIILGCIPPLSLILMQRIISLLEQGNQSINNILSVIIAYLLLDVVSEIVENIQNYSIFNFKAKISLEIKEMMLNKSSRLSLEQFEDSETYDKVQRAKNQDGGIVFSYFSHFLSIFRSFISIFAYIIIILFWRWYTIIPVVTFAIIKSIVITKMNEKQYKIIRERTDKEREQWYYEFLLTNDIAFKEIKLHQLGRVFVNRYKALFSMLFDQDKRIYKKFGINNTILSLVDIFITGVVFILIIIDTLAQIISIADTITYTRSFTSLKKNIQSVMMQVTSIYRDTLYISELFEFLEFPEERIDRFGKSISRIELIEIVDLSYKYPNSNQFALKNINLTVKRGQLCAILGKNGSGKSTLAKLISGYYDDYSGTIRINGVDLKTLNKEKYRKQVSVFFQDYAQFELTARENVSLGSGMPDKISDFEIEKYLEKLGMNRSKFQNLDKRLGFWFSNGTQLSGGEWAKIILARVAIKKASLNIFDEPTASLDAESERLAFSQISSMRESLLIVITHKMSALRSYADSLIILHNGEIVSKGLHEELLECPYYISLLQVEAQESVI